MTLGELPDEAKAGLVGIQTGTIGAWGSYGWI